MIELGQSELATALATAGVLGASLGVWKLALRGKDAVLPERDTADRTRHVHVFKKRDPEYGFYICNECGDRYLDGRPKRG